MSYIMKIKTISIVKIFIYLSTNFVNLIFLRKKETTITSRSETLLNISS